MNDNRGILVVSFGTTHADTREKTIDRLEAEVKNTFKDYKIYSAWTSSIIRKKLLARGENIDDVASAMEKISKDGIKKLYILSTHFLNGIEYEKLCSQAMEKSELFEEVVISKALFTGTKDMENVLNIINKEIYPEADRAVVAVGHGSEHFSDSVYGALDYMAKARGFGHIFIGTIEGFPNMDVTLEAVKKAGYKKVLLTPLMLVAGDHAKNDIASDDEDSWKTAFQEEGIDCDILLKGLGEYEGIREIYMEHLRNIL